MLFGFDISSMSAWIGSDQYLEYFGHPGSTEQGGITASMSAGSFVGALAAGFLADHLAAGEPSRPPPSSGSSAPFYNVPRKTWPTLSSAASSAACPLV